MPSPTYSPLRAQLQAELALKRRNLTLWRAPRATLRHFCANAASAAVRGTAWTVHHPLTLFIALPVLLLYVAWKASGELDVTRQREAQGFRALAFWKGHTASRSASGG